MSTRAFKHIFVGETYEELHKEMSKRIGKYATDHVGKLVMIAQALPQSCLGVYFCKFGSHAGWWEVSHYDDRARKRIKQGYFRTYREALECRVAWEQMKGWSSTMNPYTVVNGNSPAEARLNALKGIIIENNMIKRERTRSAVRKAQR